jgi:hypothetical protein
MAIEIKDMSKPSKDEYQWLNPNLPKPPFSVAFVGPSRSGKSNCIRNHLLRKDMLKNVFGKNRIFIFCPSLDLNSDFDDIDTKYKFNSFAEAKVNEIVSKQEDIVKRYGQDYAYDLLLVFDDVFDDPHFMRSRILPKLCMRGRHSKISVIFSGQRLKAIPRACRLNLTHLVMFRPTNLSEMDQLAEEYVNKDLRKHAVEKFKEVFREPYACIVFDNLSKDFDKRIRVNFHEPIVFE